MTRPYQPLTEHLCVRAELLSRSHPRKVVAEILGVSYPTLSRAKRRGWRTAPVGYPRRPMPTDFAIMSRRMSQTALTHHYSASTRTITRWIRELKAQGR